jgi:MFS family permease
MREHRTESLWSVLKRRWPLFIYVVVLMTAFNLFSHGTQDMYPTFLQVQHKFGTHAVSILTIIGNVGAIVGGLAFGALSQRIGRRRAPDNSVVGVQRHAAPAWRGCVSDSGSGAGCVGCDSGAPQ